MSTFHYSIVAAKIQFMRKTDRVYFVLFYFIYLQKIQFYEIFPWWVMGGSEPSVN